MQNHVTLNLKVIRQGYTEMAEMLNCQSETNVVDDAWSDEDAA